MDQVSRPFQIALVAVVLLAGMWFTVLRPKSGTDAAAPAPGVTGLSSAVDKAHGAAAASGAADAAVQAATGDSATSRSTASTPATPATPSPAKATADHAKPSAAKATGHHAKPSAAKPSGSSAGTRAKDPSAKLLASLRHGRTLVFLFHGKGADDHAARQAVRRATRGDHHVKVAMAPISKVGDYEAITAQTNVLTAPTILVIGPDRQAVSLTGYVDQRNVAQAIGDVRRAARQAAKQ